MFRALAELTVVHRTPAVSVGHLISGVQNNAWLDHSEWIGWRQLSFCHRFRNDLFDWNQEPECPLISAAGTYSNNKDDTRTWLKRVGKLSGASDRHCLLPGCLRR
jgi:hypothetical protein